MNLLLFSIILVRIRLKDCGLIPK